MARLPHARRATLERAREALEQGDYRGAVRLGWTGAIAGARARNAVDLEAVRALAVDVRTQTEGREREEARSLAVYCETALTQIQIGIRERSPLMRMLSREPHDSALKICPDCAESVQPAARICRFCGYEFEPRATP